MMAFLSKDQILEVEDVPVQDVPVPEWGGEVRVRGLTGKERDGFESEIVSTNGNQTQRNTQNIRARLLQLTLVDENNKRLFSHRDVAALGAKSAKALDRVFTVAMQLSGLSAGDVEELAENLSDGQSEDSTFD